MFFQLVLLILCSILALGLYIKKRTNWQNPPPGPPIHPLFGAIPTLAKQDPIIYKAFGALSSLYGPVLRLVIGVDNFVLVSGFQEMNDIFNRKELDDRTDSPTASLVIHGGSKKDSQGSLSFLFNGRKKDQDSDSEKWRELRRFTLKTLRDLGFGKSGSEENILEETNYLIEYLKKKSEENNGVVSLERMFNCAALNVIWKLIAAKRFDYDDQNMQKLLAYVGHFMLLGKDIIGKPLGQYPILRFLPHLKNRIQRMIDGMAAFREFIEEAIEERKTIYDKDDPECFIDVFLNKIMEDDTGVYTEPQLNASIKDLFIAGSETTSKSLQYAIAFLLNHPEVQDKLHKDLDEFCNMDRSRTITMMDKTSLPYVEATVNEVWRLGHIVPVAPPRKVPYDVQIGDYKYPKGTIVGYNNYNVHMDPQRFPQPDMFKPERFLEEGKYKHDEAVIPFGVGRRKCLGESLARMENFLFFTNMIQKFEFKPVGDKPPSLEPELGFTNAPQPFETLITYRA